MNINISCTICYGDLFTTGDDQSICSTSCGHVYHNQCLVQWMERSRTCPHCRNYLGYNDVFKLNLLIGETSEVQSMVQFKELENRVKHLTNVELDLRTQLDTQTRIYDVLLQQNTSAISECEKLRRTIQIKNETLKVQQVAEQWTNRALVRENKTSRQAIQVINELSTVYLDNKQRNDALVLENETLRRTFQKEINELKDKLVTEQRKNYTLVLEKDTLNQTFQMQINNLNTQLVNEQREKYALVLEKNTLNQTFQMQINQLNTQLVNEQREKYALVQEKNTLN